jgi:hypothetical protein
MEPHVGAVADAGLAKRPCDPHLHAHPVVRNGPVEQAQHRVARAQRGHVALEGPAPERSGGGAARRADEQAVLLGQVDVVAGPPQPALDLQVALPFHLVEERPGDVDLHAGERP